MPTYPFEGLDLKRVRKVRKSSKEKRGEEKQKETPIVLSF